MPKQRSGRRPGDTSTRQAILDAAVSLFAERGYDRATLREITARAGVDPALVSHFFGNKEGLFDEAILQASAAAEPLVESVTNRSGDGIGLRVAHAYLALWETEPTASTLRALLRAAIESENNRERLEGAVTQRIKEVLDFVTRPGNGGNGTSPWKAEEPTSFELQLLAAQLIGIGLARYILRIPPLANVDRELLIHHIARIVESSLPKWED